MEERRIIDVLKQFRILYSHKGCGPLVDTVKLLCENPERLDRPLNEVLREVAARYDSTDTKIYDNIDTLCKKIQRRSLEHLSKLAGYTIEGKPQVKELVEILVNYLLRNPSQS